MQTETPAVLITPATYAARQAALDTLTTPALQKARQDIEQEAERQESGEDRYSLICLADWAGTLLDLRKNGYSGDYED